MEFKKLLKEIINSYRNIEYKGFKIGDEVIVLKDVKCQYYHYPTPKSNDYILKKGKKAFIKNIIPKVRIIQKGSGTMFFNLVEDLERNYIQFPVFDYKDIKKVKKMNKPLSESNPEKAAKIIIDQLGGYNKLVTMIGARNFGYESIGNGSLSFKFARGKSGIKYVKIILNDKDLYDMIFYNNSKSVKRFNDVYFDQLVDIFEKTTGLYLSL